MADINKICEHKTDEEIAELVLRDQAYLTCLIDRYKNKLFHYIKRLSRASDEDAEDILQDVFMKVYLNLNDFDTDLKFSSWIYRITHNEVISQFRKNKARPQGHLFDVDDEALNSIIGDLNITKDIDRKILRANIEKILDSLDLKYKELLVLKFLEEKSYKEISDILKKPMGTIASLINRAKGEFRKELDRQNIML